MSNLVLYRKYRPGSFGDVVGQEHVVRTVTNAIAANDVAHAYLFAGPRGTGKTTLARLIAKAVNCQTRKDGTYEPCGTCDSCDEISRGISVDLIEIDAASNRGIDEIRALKEGVRFVPTKSKYKVFVVDEVHMLTKEAFNALLKTLEEPPAHALFILATTELKKVLPTIVSRSQRFEFRRLRHREIKDRLVSLIQKEGKKVDGKALDIIAARADGSVRDAESMLGQILLMGSEVTADEVCPLFGLADFTQISSFLNYLVQNDAKSALCLLGELGDRGMDQEEFVKNVLGYVRWMMFIKIDANLGELIAREISQEDLSELTDMAHKFEMPRLQKAASLFLEAHSKIKYSPIPQLPTEMAVVEFCSAESPGAKAV